MSKTPITVVVIARTWAVVSAATCVGLNSSRSVWSIVAICDVVKPGKLGRFEGGDLRFGTRSNVLRRQRGNLGCRQSFQMGRRHLGNIGGAQPGGLRRRKRLDLRGGQLAELRLIVPTGWSPTDPDTASW